MVKVFFAPDIVEGALSYLWTHSPFIAVKESLKSNDVLRCDLFLK